MTRGWKIVDLFSGIGGFSLAARMAGLADAPLIFCETDPFCRATLAKHWPAVPCAGDVRKLAAADWLPELASIAAGEAPTEATAEIDLVCGGFP